MTRRLGDIAYAIALTIDLSSCGPVAQKSEGTILMNSPETDLAIAFAKRDLVTRHSDVWVRESWGAQRALFRRNLQIAGEAGQELVTLHGEVIARNSAAQRNRYEELAAATSKGRLRPMQKLAELDLIPLDQGRNVASVRFLGSKDQAMECEITGFHMPTYLARCSWVEGDTSFSIEGDHRVLGFIVQYKSDLSTTWNASVGQ